MKKNLFSLSQNNNMLECGYGRAIDTLRGLLRKVFILVNGGLFWCGSLLNRLFIS